MHFARTQSDNINNKFTSPMQIVWGFFNTLKPIKVEAIELHLRG